LVEETLLNIRGHANNKAGWSIEILLICAALVSFIGLSCGHTKIEGIHPLELKCEYSDYPLGIENKNPKLSWILNSDIRNQKQSAYRILVAGSLENLKRNFGDLWDSHKVISDESVHILYNGKPLGSGMHCWWKVQVWDKDNKKSDWSEPASWEMGLLKPQDWKAEWIGYECQSAPLFRKEFNTTKTVKDARVYISGLGYYELYMNGSKIGENVLDPAQTDYEQRTFYVVYDVTEKINNGENAVGIILGNGWFNQTAVNHGRYGWKDVIYGKPRLIFQMRLINSDDTEKLIVSDETWKGSSGPVISDNVYAGEVYDARLEQNGWNKAGFDDSKWNQVMISEGPGGILISQKLPPIKKIQSIQPVVLNNPEPGIYVYDMGQNFAGWARLKLKAPEGTEIQLRFAESLHQNGMIDPASTGVYATNVIQTDKYICNGNGVEVWEPRFTYHGFRYVEMRGFPGKPELENIEGVFVHTSAEKTGEFECSDTMFNKLHKTALWTEMSNMYGLPTDCPHREKCGWLGDAFLTSDMTMYNFDVPLFWSKFIGDIETSRKSGVPKNIAPGRRFGGSDPDWGAAFIQLPWNMFLYYGDKSIISEHYAGMSIFMDYLQKIAIGNIIYIGIGSLFSPGRIMPGETPVEYTSSVLYYFCANAMARMARAINKEEDSQQYLQTALKIKFSFNRKFYNISEKTYGCQEKNTLALAFGLVPEKDESAVAENLNNYVVNQQNGHVFTGIFGSRYIYETLAKYGYEETVRKILDQTTYPGYGYLFSRGATTFWENWGEMKFDDNLKPGDERSKNHPFQGGFDAWFYNGIAGISPDPENPGFKHIIFKPHIINSLDFEKTQFNSIHGMIKSELLNSGDQLTWLVSIPPNSTATAFLPAVSKDALTESGVPISETEGVKFLRMENGNAVLEIGSGKYEFIIKKNTH
jgi:alpha-L-rhamnosidase